MTWKVVLSALGKSGSPGVWVQADAFPTHVLNWQILLQHTYMHPHTIFIYACSYQKNVCGRGRGCSLKSSSGYVIRGMQVTRCDTFDSRVSSQLTLLQYVTK